MPGTGNLAVYSTGKESKAKNLLFQHDPSQQLQMLDFIPIDNVVFIPHQGNVSICIT